MAFRDTAFGQMQANGLRFGLVLVPFVPAYAALEWLAVQLFWRHMVVVGLASVLTILLFRMKGRFPKYWRSGAVVVLLGLSGVVGAPGPIAGPLLGILVGLPAIIMVLYIMFDIDTDRLDKAHIASPKKRDGGSGKAGP